MKKQRVINSQQLSTQSLQRSPHSERREALWLCLRDPLPCFQELRLSRPVLHLPQTPINIPTHNYHARKVHFSCCNSFPYVTWLEKKEDWSKLGCIISTNIFLRSSALQTSLHLLIQFWKEERRVCVGGWGEWVGRETRRQFDIISSVYRLRIWFIAKH